MIGIGIRYLCGWAAARDPATADEPEWPPHPARVFMALAAAHFETRDDPPTEGQRAERRALEWLEAAGPPALKVSGKEVRSPVTVFVPVNDTEISSRTDPTTASEEVVKQGLAVLPDRRSRQKRTFPRAFPHEDIVWLTWPDSEIEEGQFEALVRVCGKVTRIGHSSSMVQVWAARGEEIPEPDLVPGAEVPTTRLRVTARGLMDDLEANYNAGLRPSISLWEHYGYPDSDAAVPGSVFDPGLMVVSIAPGADTQHTALPLSAAGQVVDYFRRAVIATAPDPVPESLSGHAPAGTPSNRMHAAFFPLPFIGRRHADGHIMGLGVALPTELPPEEMQMAQEALAALTTRPDDDSDPGRLVMGRLGRWRLQPLGAATIPYSLRSETWTAPASVWASATPVVLDRFTHDEEEKKAIVATACERIGLPRPAEVRLSHVSALEGAPPSPEFGPLPRSDDRAARPFTHAVLFFGEDDAPVSVRGPVLIGAGRYRGYGLFRPLHHRSSTSGGGRER